MEGRKHMQVQTELYLEEITDRVEEADNQTQTDAFLDRPPTPLFVPAKTGMDVATQIEEGDVSMHIHGPWVLNWERGLIWAKVNLEMKLEARQPHVGTTQTLPSSLLPPSLYSCLTLILRCDQSWRYWLGRQWSRPCWR